VHIEPGIVEGSKVILSYGTAGGVGLYALHAAWQAVKERGPFSLLFRALGTSALVLVFFQIFPHVRVGISEVHLIFGSTLFLLFGMNITTLLVPLFGLQYVAKRVIAPNTPYVQLRYRQALALSTTYQAGIVTWVGFWALYGQGFAAANVQSIAVFGAAYLAVILIEPLADLAVLAGAKSLRQFKDSSLLEPRLLNPA